MFLANRLAGLLLAIVTLAAAGTPHTKAEVESIILRSRHLGAHGMGYNERSLVELSHALTADDIPNLISLLGDGNLRVGAEVALASQCEAALQPLREAAVEDDKG